MSTEASSPQHMALRQAKQKRAELDAHEKDPLLPGNPSDHYQMSLSKHYPLDLHAWLADNNNDPTILVWLFH